MSIRSAASRSFVSTLVALWAVAGAAASAQVVATTSISANPQSLGEIPQPRFGCPELGPPLDVTFTVAGVAGAVQNVFLESFELGHSFVGDLLVELIAPNGVSHDLFGFTGITSAGSRGSSSTTVGPYIFADLATASWWSAAAMGSPIPIGVYRTSERGGLGSTGAATSMDAAFSRISPNGTWILRVTDGCLGRYPVGIGGVTRATLTLVTTDIQAPTNLVAASVSGNRVTLRWNPPTGGPVPTGYVLEGGLNPGEVLASIPTGSTSPIFTFTAPTGSYLVRMHTEANGRKSGPSNEIRLNVNLPVTPSAPVNLLGAVNGLSLALAWTNTYTGGTPQSIVLDVAGSASASIPLGAVDHVELTGVPSGTYVLSVRAANAGGTSGPSNVITLTPGAVPAVCTGPPLTPTNFLAYNAGTTLSLIWEPAPTGPAPTGSIVHATGAALANVSTSGRTLSGTVASGTYNLSVSATNMCGASAATPVQTVTIP